MTGTELADMRVRPLRVARLALIAFVASLALASAASAASRGPDFVRAFGALGHPTCTTMCEMGSRGTGADQLDRPRASAVSASGDVYVANDSNHRIDEFTQAGAFVRAFGQGVNPTDSSDVCDATSGCQAGNASDGAAAIDAPTGVAVSGSSHVYVADDSNHRIDEFTQTGTFVRAFGKDVGGPGVDTCTASCQAGSASDGAGELGGPAGVAVTASGDVYVTDDSNARIDEFDQTGTFVRAFGKGVNTTDGSDICDAGTGCQAGFASTGAGSLDGPTGLAVSGLSHVYVADDSNARIDEFTQTGTFVQAFGKDVGGAGVDTCTASCQQGSPVAAAGAMGSPFGVAVSGSGDVYVGDDLNARIDEFTSTGTFMRAFGKDVNATDGSDVCTAVSGCQQGGSSDSAGEISLPYGVAVDGSSDVYVADYSNARVDEFTQSGSFVRAFGDAVGFEPFNCSTASGCQAGGSGSGAGQLNGPTAVAVSGSGEVYVADNLNNRIDVFDAFGSFVRAFGKNVGGIGVNVCTTTCRTGDPGHLAGQLHAPSAVAVLGSGDVYVTDLLNDRVDEFTQSGTFVRAFGKGVGPGGADVCTNSCQAGAGGAGAGELNGPQGLAIGTSGHVYVADRDNNRMAEFTADGVFVRVFGKDVGGSGSDVCTTSCQMGSQGGAAGQFSFPSGVAVSGSGDIYVADQYNGRVDVFSQSGSFVRAFGKDVGGAGVDTCTTSCQVATSGTEAGQFAPLSGVAVVGSGDVYVAEGDNRLDEFTQSGRFLRAFGKAVNVADGSDVCTAASGCRMGDTGGDAGEFAGVFSVALGGSGEIYVADFGNERIDEYSPFVNSAPVAADDSYSTTPNTALTISAPANGVLANDTDADGDPLTAVSYTDPSHGTLAHNADGTFTYTPAAGFQGSDSFAYSANDGYADSGSAATVTIAVNAGAVAPPPPVTPVGPRRIALVISHRHVPRVGRYVKVRILCRGTAGARCTGRLALDLTKDKSRLKAAAAPGRDGRAKFNVAAGKDGTVRVKASSRLLQALRHKRRGIVMATATFTGANGKLVTVKRKLTVID